MKSPLVPAILACAACAGAPVPQPPPDRDLLRTPAGLHTFFTTAVARDQLGWAYRVLTPRARAEISQDEFTLALRNEAVARLVTGTRIAPAPEDPNGTRTHLTIEHPEFGFRRRIAVTRDSGGFWLLDLTREDFDAIAQAVQRWYTARPRHYDGRRHAFPPGWTHPALPATDLPSEADR